MDIPAGDEARRFFNHHRFFGHALADFDDRRQCICVSLQSTHHFEQFHFVYWIEEVHTDAFLRAVGNAGNFRDA